MSKKLFSIIGALAFAFAAIAQPNVQYSKPKAATLDKGTNAMGNIIEGGLGWLSTNELALTTSKWTVAPYVTYAPDIDADDKVGGGILAAYAINDVVSAAVGIDWLGNLSMPSGNVELHKSFRPLTSYGLTNFVVTPFGIAGISTPLSAAGTGDNSIATLYGGGLAVTAGTIKDNPVSVGAAWVRWENIGDYTGDHFHFFVAFHF